MKHSRGHDPARQSRAGSQKLPIVNGRSCREQAPGAPPYLRSGGPTRGCMQTGPHTVPQVPSGALTQINTLVPGGL